MPFHLWLGSHELQFLAFLINPLLSSVEWVLGRFSLRTCMGMPVRPSPPPLGSGWLGLRPGWMVQRGERTYRRKDILRENFPILQDFAPYQGRCPASPHETKEKVEQGKGTADPSLIYSHIFSYFLLHLFQANKTDNIKKQPETNRIYLQILSPESKTKLLC